MKKKFYIIVCLFFIVSTAFAEDFDVLTVNFQPWGNTQFDVKTMKITWSKEWEGGGWWLARDCTEYNYAVIEFKDNLPMDVVVTVIYSAKDEKNEKLNSKKTILAGEKKISIALDPTYKISVDGIGISGSKQGSVTLKSFILKDNQE